MKLQPARWVGRPIKRREDPRFLRGHAQFVDDIVLPGMLHMVVVRSPLAHARLRKIDLDKVRQVPGVVAAVSGRDLLNRVRPIPINPVEGAQVAEAPHPLLATEKVRYVGEPVAAVVGETLQDTQDAAELVEVDYEQLPVLLDPHDALQSKVLLHEALGENVLGRWSRAHGDVEGAFATSAHIVRQHFHIPRLVAAPIEPHGAVASYDAGLDLLTVWCSAQDPHRPLGQLSRVLDRPEDRIRMVVPDVGGAFGSKGTLRPETGLAAWLAMQLGRPVKWIEERRENFLASYQGRGLDADVEMAVDAHGHIVAVRARLVADVGAYLYPPTPLMPVTTSMLLTGTYAVPNAAVELVEVATNKVPTGPYRGAGRPEATYLVERMIDLVARDVGLDPVEVRRRNVIHADRFPYRTPLGFVYDSGQYERALERICTLVEYDRWRDEQRQARANGRLLGIGVTMYVERAGSQLWESAAASISPGGRVIVRMGSTPSGQGHETTFAQIAADALQIDLNSIVVESGDSAKVPRGVGTFGSRSTTIGGSALLVVLDKIKAKATGIAAHLLEAAVEDIEWNSGRLHVRGAPDRAVTLKDVATAAYTPGRLPSGMEMGLQAVGVFTLPGFVFPFGAYAAVVEVERETGELRILKLVAVDDAGRIVNPLLAEGQVIGACVQGLGQALMEEAVYGEDGQLLTSTFTEYSMPRAAQVPEIESEFLETPSPFNPLGAKGIGEAGAIATPAVIASAVHDALAPLAVRHIDFPLTPLRLWRVLQNAAGP